MAWTLLHLLFPSLLSPQMAAGLWQRHNEYASLTRKECICTRTCISLILFYTTAKYKCLELYPRIEASSFPLGHHCKGEPCQACGSAINQHRSQYSITSFAQGSSSRHPDAVRVTSTLLTSIAASLFLNAASISSHQMRQTNCVTAAHLLHCTWC